MRVIKRVIPTKGEHALRRLQKVFLFLFGSSDSSALTFLLGT